MNLQGSLQMQYNEETFHLVVKTFLKNGVYYFFVSDKEKEKPLLNGETLELRFDDSFCTSAKDEMPENQKIPAELVSAIEKMLMENKPLWFY
ncbi:MAG: hypothetical protein JWQ09_1323 [Segetibacter sp.]|nr:hypothetical protein [Segetibacter sp.]